MRPTLEQELHEQFDDALNVLGVEVDDMYRILKVIDLEDSHLGDPAEDFKWQLAQGGPPWQDFGTMASSYSEAGGMF